MKKRDLCLLAVSIMLAVFLTACNNNASEQGVETQTVEDAAKMQTGEYSINRTSVDDSDSTDADYEIDDMLPRPSEDTFIMSVEDALELMNKNADGSEQAIDEQQ